MINCEGICCPCSTLYKFPLPFLAILTICFINTESILLIILDYKTHKFDLSKNLSHRNSIIPLNFFSLNQVLSSAESRPTNLAYGTRLIFIQINLWIVRNRQQLFIRDAFVIIHFASALITHSIKCVRAMFYEKNEHYHSNWQILRLVNSFELIQSFSDNFASDTCFLHWFAFPLSFSRVLLNGWLHLTAHLKVTVILRFWSFYIINLHSV